MSLMPNTNPNLYWLELRVDSCPEFGVIYDEDLYPILAWEHDTESGHWLPHTQYGKQGAAREDIDPDGLLVHASLYDRALDQAYAVEGLPVPLADLRKAVMAHWQQHTGKAETGDS